MKRFVTPAETYLSEDEIPNYRATRRRTSFKGCTQINQIFLKSDGKISCSCMKYWDVLADAKKTNVAEFFNGTMMRYIRESFHDGFEPFHFCADCPSRHTKHEFKTNLDTVDLHIEPSNRCNLFCDACTCTFERQSTNPPGRVNLSPEIYEKVVREIHDAGLKVPSIAFVGFGEPLFCSDVPAMARLGRSLFPDSHIYLDTNANFGERRAEELADCGFDEIRLALDGSDQESYEGYRKVAISIRRFGLLAHSPHRSAKQPAQLAPYGSTSFLRTTIGTIRSWLQFPWPTRSDCRSFSTQLLARSHQSARSRRSDSWWVIV